MGQINYFITQPNGRLLFVRILSIIIAILTLCCSAVGLAGGINEFHLISTDMAVREESYKHEFEIRREMGIAMTVVSIVFALIACLLLFAVRAIDQSPQFTFALFVAYCVLQILAGIALALIFILGLRNTPGEVFSPLAVIPGAAACAYPVFLLFFLPSIWRYART